MKCIHCQKDLPDGVKFCKYCGQKQEAVQPTPKITQQTIAQAIPATEPISVSESKEQPSIEGWISPSPPQPTPLLILLSERNPPLGAQPAQQGHSTGNIPSSSSSTALTGSTGSCRAQHPPPFPGGKVWQQQHGASHPRMAPRMAPRANPFC